MLQLLRTMEYASPTAREVELVDMQDAIGEQAFMSPSVFNFYLPEFQPLGPVLDAGLVSPEAEIRTGPSLIAYANGVFSLAEFGLTKCYDGWGTRVNAGVSCSSGDDYAQVRAPAPRAPTGCLM